MVTKKEINERRKELLGEASSMRSIELRDYICKLEEEYNMPKHLMSSISSLKFYSKSDLKDRIIFIKLKGYDKSGWQYIKNLIEQDLDLVNPNNKQNETK